MHKKEAPDMAEYQAKTITSGACTITLLRPVLTPADRSKREQQVRTTLEHALRDYYIRKERKS